MDYEQKYKEALKVMESLYNVVKYQSSSDALLTCQTCEKAFPELKESEDEGIRKEIISYIKSSGAVTNPNWIAWLEKQGEQKPTDKIEPKFKVGDWVVYHRNDSSREIMNVYDIRDNRYYFNDNIHFSWSVKECDEKCHLWTIQDAKDGDMLANKYGAIFINAGNNGGVTLDCYCYLSVQNKFCIEEHKTGSWFYKNNIKPATKEQRDLLFQQMKEAGYEWDANIKELKKIEQKPSWSEEDEKNLKLLNEVITDSRLTATAANILSNWLKSIKERVLPKQEWSSDDLLKYNQIIDILQDCNQTELIDWLESIEPNHWKPSEEEMEALLYALGKGGTYNREALNRLYNNLKKL